MVCSSGHFGPRLDASSCPQGTRTPSLASTVQREKNIILLGPQSCCIRGNEKADAAAKAGLLRRVTDVPIPFGDFKKHISALLKCKWESQWDEAVNNKLHGIHPQHGLWPGGSTIIRRKEYGKPKCHKVSIYGIP